MVAGGVVVMAGIVAIHRGVARRTELGGCSGRVVSAGIFEQCLGRKRAPGIDAVFYGTATVVGGRSGRCRQVSPRWFGKSVGESTAAQWDGSSGVRVIHCNGIGIGILIGLYQ